MRMVIVFLLMAMATPAMAASGMSEEQGDWFRCATDHDCMVASGICGNPQAVNKAFAQAFADYIREKEVGVSCSPPTAAFLAWRERVIAKCIGGRCVLVDPQDAKE